MRARASLEDAEYTIKVMNMVKLFGKPLRINKASQDKKVLDVGANLFIGNLPYTANVKELNQIFNVYGEIEDIQMMNDPNAMQQLMNMMNQGGFGGGGGMGGGVPPGGFGGGGFGGGGFGM